MRNYKIVYNLSHKSMTYATLFGIYQITDGTNTVFDSKRGPKLLLMAGPHISIPPSAEILYLLRLPPRNFQMIECFRARLSSHSVITVRTFIFANVLGIRCFCQQQWRDTKKCKFYRMSTVKQSNYFKKTMTFDVATLLRHPVKTF